MEMTTTNDAAQPTNFVNMVEPLRSITIEQQRRPLETSEITSATNALQDSSYVCFPDSQQEAIETKESLWCTFLIYQQKDCAYSYVQLTVSFMFDTSSLQQICNPRLKMYGTTKRR